MAWFIDLPSFACFLLLCKTIGAYHLGLRIPKDTILTSHQQLAPRRTRGLSLNNSADVSYYAQIGLGNQTFTVLVDTGSSDLWVAGLVSPSNSTGFNATIKYAADSVVGPIKQARLTFADYVVMDQAFLEVPPDEANPEGYGIVGLGPSSGSFISKLLPGSTGFPVLNQIFAQNRSTQNYFTLLLGRDKDPTDFFSGTVTVSEVLPQYSAVLDEEKLTITSVANTASDDQHLQILLDADGITGPDGRPIPIESTVDQTSDKKRATVVLDSGFTLPQLPQSVVDAIYNRFEGADFRQIPGIGGAYILPCEQEVNITFKFSGKIYPIHPLDMSLEPSSIKLQDIQTTDGQKACIGTFQPFTYDRGDSPNYDMVLGMAFLRNVYTLFDYGDFIQDSTQLADSYIKLLSITNVSEAHQDFVTIRLGGIDTTASKGLKYPVMGKSNRKTVYYIVISVVVGSILGAVVIFFLLRTSRKGR